MPYTDDIATNALKNSDKKAFTWIYNKYFHQLCFYAEKIIDNKETAEDIAQEVFMKLWGFREKIVVQLSLNAYLYGSVYNSCMNHIKRLNRRREYHENMMIENSQESEINNPMFMIISKETIHEIEQLIAALPELYSNIITLAQGALSYEEIAQEMKIPVNSVGPILNRAKKMMSKNLGGDIKSML
jgi:RNA polymerase sigma-70 factor (ECF subfamily)